MIFIKTPHLISILKFEILKTPHLKICSEYAPLKILLRIRLSMFIVQPICLSLLQCKERVYPSPVDNSLLVLESVPQQYITSEQHFIVSIVRCQSLSQYHNQTITARQCQFYMKTKQLASVISNNQTMQQLASVSCICRKVASQCY